MSSLGLTCMPVFCAGETKLVCTDETAMCIGTDEQYINVLEKGQKDPYFLIPHLIPYMTLCDNLSGPNLIKSTNKYSKIKAIFPSGAS